MTFIERTMLTLCVLFSVGCSKGDPPKSSAPPVAAENGSERGRPEASLFDLTIELTDQKGTRFSLDELRGHPTVVSMFYADCPFVCPTLISDVRRLEEKLSGKARSEVRVLLVSFDTERDTPERLAALMRERRLDGARWRLARGSEDHVRELAAALDIKYRRLVDGNYNHSSAVILLRADGTVATRSEGLAQPMDGLAARTTELLAGGR